MPPGTQTRTYNSPRRREQAAATRRAIVDAARELFERQGYAATTIAEVAKRAGVAEKTVYLAFEKKSGLMRGILNVALRGADGTTPVADQEWYREVLTADDPRRALELNARNARVLKARVGAAGAVFRSAAAADSDIRDLWEERVHGDFYENQRLVVESIAARGGLREDLDVERATDILWTLNHPDVWAHLVEDRGWSPEQYERWLADATSAQLLKAR